MNIIQKLTKPIETFITRVLDQYNASHAVGYQPIKGTLDRTNPPRNGSGVPRR